MSVVLKMGREEIFRENLQNLKNMGNNRPGNYQNNNNNNNYMDIIPKFLYNKNKEMINQENINKLANKKETLTKLLNTYFNNKLDTSYYEKIQNLENEIQNQERNVNLTNKNDFNTFKDLINFIISVEKENNIEHLKNISEEDYLNLQSGQKNEILEYINKHKIEFIENLGINEINNNDPFYNNINNNLYNPQQNQYNQNIGYNANNNKINMNNQYKFNNNIYSAEKIDLFRNMIGIPDYPEQNIKVYLNPSNPTVINAVEKYYQNSYQTSKLVLYYNYPAYANKGKKMHSFKFTDKIDDLFLITGYDYPSYINSSLYLENGKEIKNDKRFRCIGALQLSNKSIINVMKK